MQNFNLGSKPGKKPKLTEADAQSIAIEALGYLAGDPERLEQFLALSGLGPGNLRAAAAEPGFLAAVLDYLGSDETLLLAFANSAGRDPATLAKAREILAPSGETSI
jgi:hypothetical protein